MTILHYFPSTDRYIYTSKFAMLLPLPWVPLNVARVPKLQPLPRRGLEVSKGSHGTSIDQRYSRKTAGNSINVFYRI